ncbi:MAG: DUF6817 domain-containing protein [Chlamydiota bacterium]
MVEPIIYYLKKRTDIKIKNFVRIKANLIPRIVQTEEWLENLIHQDMSGEGHFISLIYYIDDSDGETTIYQDDMKTAIEKITPTANKGTLIDSKTWHRSAVPFTHKRRMVINFVFEVESPHISLLDYKDEEEERLDAFLTMIGAKEMPHKEGTLYEHLMGTYYTLKFLFDNSTLALIGGLHSIYGTTIYKKTCLPEDTHLVIKVFGEEVDRLVRLFCKIDRKVLETPDGSLSEQDLALLRLVEVANLYDQGSIHTRPYLMKFAQDVKRQLEEARVEGFGEREKTLPIGTFSLGV